MSSRAERIRDVLRSLKQATPDVLGSAVVSSDGLIIASLLPEEIDEELVSAMAAAMLGVGERISAELMSAKMEQTYVQSDRGFVVVNSVGAESAFVVLTTKDAKLGLMLMDVRRRSAELEEIV